jgi:hypothetical protein
MSLCNLSNIMMTSNSQLALTNSWEFVAVLDLGLGFNVRIRIGIRFESHRGQAYFSSLPSVDIHSE